MTVSPPPSSETPPSPEVLLQRIAELEENHAFLQLEIAKLIQSQKLEPIKDGEEVSRHPYCSQCSSSCSTRPQLTQNRTSFAGIPPPFAQSRGGYTGQSYTSWSRSLRSKESTPMPGSHLGRWAHRHGNVSQFAPFPEQLTERHYINILQSMGHAIYIFNLSAEVIYWNRTAELLYGYSEEEVLGRNVLELLVHKKHIDLGWRIVSRLMVGEHWNGQFPLMKKSGELFNAFITNSPLYDENGVQVGVIAVTNDSRPFSKPLAIEGIQLPAPVDIEEVHSGYSKQEQMQAQSQFLQAPLTSSLSNLASKVTSKVTAKVSSAKLSSSKMFSLMRGESSVEHEGGSGGSQGSEAGHSELVGLDVGDFSEQPLSAASSVKNLSPQSTISPPLSGKYEEGGSQHVQDKKAGGFIFLSSKAESWMAKKGVLKPDRNNAEQKRGLLWRWPLSELAQGKVGLGSSRPGSTGGMPKAPAERDEGDVEQEELDEAVRSIKLDATESPRSRNWAIVSSTSSNSSTATSTNSSYLPKSETEVDVMDCEIEWESLIVAEQIGQGSCGTVYRGFWIGSFLQGKITQ